MILGLVLAGGRSSRMGREKAFVPFRGEPLLVHVLRRFSVQVDALALNANGDPERFASFGLPIVADDPAHIDCGPLAGVLAGLAHARSHGADRIVTVPCDAPFLPADLAARLAAAADGDRVALAARDDRLEPTFGLWPVSVEPRLVQVMAAGTRAVRSAAAACGLVTVAFPAQAGVPDPFLNLNAPDELEAAERGADDRG